MLSNTVHAESRRDKGKYHLKGTQTFGSNASACVCLFSYQLFYQDLAARKEFLEDCDLLPEADQKCRYHVRHSLAQQWQKIPSDPTHPSNNTTTLLRFRAVTLVYIVRKSMINRKTSSCGSRQLQLGSSIRRYLHLSLGYHQNGLPRKMIRVLEYRQAWYKSRRIKDNVQNRGDGVFILLGAFSGDRYIIANQAIPCHENIQSVGEKQQSEKLVWLKNISLSTTVEIRIEKWSLQLRNTKRIVDIWRLS
ncbi:hypothetical protein HYFRA_00003803 [Hymenoscyphus fraxineus]|uniref:Uncharacterized protein n=1 Tax=Hymenoscyphus fraxineus TaxID=746836 RepID=A0A9N9PUP4_9HELO|nr:hypothetical protein HYFRA_00003803 [Hymenoscyphus fraxineus]